jgi:hypothetical protein
LKSLMLFLQEVLIELGTRCGTSTTDDYKTIVRRVDDEGISFLTITLPNFAKDFQKSLDLSQVDHDHFKGFSFKGGLPRFLGGFLDLIFDRNSGRLLDKPNIDAIFAVQQVTMLFGKILLDCSEARVKAAIDGYVKCEQEVRDNDRLLSSERKEQFSRISTLLWADVFSKVDKSIFDGGIVPKHGPGSTAERILGNQKFVQTEWPERVESMFPALENMLASFRDYSSLDEVDFLEPGRERPVRVVTVPKTLKTPRIIAIEPVAVQYMQQGLLEVIENEVEASDKCRQLIGWKSQIPNQELARIGSITGDLATLDLSEASDRVSNQLVRLMLSNHPHLASAVDATRSRKADVPGHGVKRLAKFASMGSALCFPIESFVFMTVVFCGIEQELKRQITESDVNVLLGSVRTYGDDIIVPVRFVRSVVDSLQTFGFKVNSDKSFWTGKFRESCGKFYYGGEDITVTRVRRSMPSQRKHAQETVSLVAMRNLFYKSGMWRTVNYLDSLLEELTKKFGWPFPKIHEGSPLLGRVTYLPLPYEEYMHDPFLQRPIVKGVVLKSVIPNDVLDGPAALLKFFLKRGELPFVDRNHLERAGRPDSVSIKVRMATPF